MRRSRVRARAPAVLGAAVVGLGTMLLSALLPASGGEATDAGHGRDSLGVGTAGAAGGAAAARPVPAGPAAVPEPKCAGAPEGAGCWKVPANKPGCHVWDSYLYPDQAVT